MSLSNKLSDVQLQEIEKQEVTHEELSRQVSLVEFPQQVLLDESLQEISLDKISLDELPQQVQHTVSLESPPDIPFYINPMKLYRINKPDGKSYCEFYTSIISVFESDENIRVTHTDKYNIQCEHHLLFKEGKIDNTVVVYCIHFYSLDESTEICEIRREFGCRYAFNAVLTIIETRIGMKIINHFHVPSEPPPIDEQLCLSPSLESLLNTELYKHSSLNYIFDMISDHLKIQYQGVRSFTSFVVSLKEFNDDVFEILNRIITKLFKIIENAVEISGQYFITHLVVISLFAIEQVILLSRNGFITFPEEWHDRVISIAKSNMTNESSLVVYRAKQILLFY
jgi:hypothetical protein